ncbi:hypothetical protein CEXT_34451 [Caerostris extrusa]|uniref:Uncharacterized protein n=1 Tax=Caerostris extrusa TaxID=172846 RepID=A0AAV4WLK3_CAEEX|nr:hypothetical protein CEXT_34451 [Caerostris extrusa]
MEWRICKPFCQTRFPQMGGITLDHFESSLVNDQQLACAPFDPHEAVGTAGIFLLPRTSAGGNSHSGATVIPCIYDERANAPLLACAVETQCCVVIRCLGPSLTCVQMISATYTHPVFPSESVRPERACVIPGTSGNYFFCSDSSAKLSGK